MTDHAHAIYFGEVTDVFARRFVVETESGKILADLGPDGPRQMTLRPGDKVTFSGEAKPSEIKVRAISRNDGPTIAIEQKKPPKNDRSEGDPNRAIETAVAKGFAVVGSPRRKPKHFEILGRDAAGDYVELHIELGGALRKTRPVAKDDAKWGLTRGTMLEV